MKVLVVGEDGEHSYETACARGFRKLGCEVHQFNNKPSRRWLGGRNWWKLTRAERLGQDLLSSWELYQAGKRWKPDLIFMCKGENIRAETFTLLKKETGCKLAIWYVDNPFNASVSSYQALRAIQKADFYFIWARYLVDPLISAGAHRAEFLPFGYDLDGFEGGPDAGMKTQEDWTSDVCFVGTWDSDREHALTPLADSGFDLAIYGQGWQRNLSASSVLRKHLRGDAIWQHDMARAFKGSKIVLNFLRRHNWQGHNLRTMEAAGIGGGALLTPWTKDQAEVLFDENREVLCYEEGRLSTADISRLLSDKESLRTTSAAARDRVMREHLLSHRLKRILEVVCS